jgi:Ca2+-transporting ATPase
LAIAEIPNAGELSNLTDSNKTQILGDITKYDNFEQGACFIGIVCIKDPVRPEVAPAIKDCHTAGIRVIMITGDSKETAIAVAKECGIIDSKCDPKKTVFTGTEFEQMTD